MIRRKFNKAVPQFAVLLYTLSVNYCFAQTTSGDELKLVSSIILPGVIGRIDHLAYDIRNQTLFIAALGNNSVEVIDVKNNKVIHSIKGLNEPQGIRYISENNTVFVANGGSGECDIFNADTYEKIRSVKMPESDADNVRYDGTSGRIFVGYGNGGIAVLDAKTLTMLADVKLPGHPESFQLDSVSKRLYVNVPDDQMLATIDPEKYTITGTWKIEIAKSNFPMATDAANRRLFTGCRNPSQLLVMDAESGKIVAQIDIDGDTDDIFYDYASKLIYVSCGSGYLDIIRQSGPDKYERIERILSRPGARTSLYVAELNKLFLAAPARSGSEAQLMIYEKIKSPRN